MKESYLDHKDENFKIYLQIFLVCKKILLLKTFRKEKINL